MAAEAVNTEISRAIERAIIEINGAADYDERVVVDEELNNKVYMYVYQNTKAELKTTNPDHVCSASPANAGDIINLTYLNYIKLLEAGVNAERALLIARVRAGIYCNKGLLVSEADTTKAIFTYKSEIRVELEDASVAIPFATLPEERRNAILGERPKELAPVFVLRFPEAHRDFMTKFNALNGDTITKMTKYLPIMAHMAFTKFGHHYIDNQFFKLSYAKHFNSLKIGTLEPTWNHAEIIYNAVHWMGPCSMMHWCRNIRIKNKMPRSLNIKFPLIPAGAALISSTVAVLKAAGAIPGFNAFYNVYAEQWRVVTEAVAVIKETPYHYHVRADLFGLASREDALIHAKEAAAVLAPAAQAFINKYAAGTDMARIQAIKKHAEANIGLMRRFEAIFAGNMTQMRQNARTKNLHELLAGVQPATQAAPEVVDEDEE